MTSPVSRLGDCCEKVTAPLRNKMSSNKRGAREAVRKRTFTRWINSHLKRCDPPLQVDDLFSDLQDGWILMALLEELSGCKMLYRFRPSTHHIFTLSNISKVLEFLEDRNVRVSSIDATDISEGRPSATLSLIWNIIVHFQLKVIRETLERQLSGSVSSLVSLSDETDIKTSSFRHKNYRSRTISSLLYCAQSCTEPFGLEVCDFGKSWRDGLAFLALVKSVRTDLVDMRKALISSPRENLTEAFRMAQNLLGISALLEPEDVMMRSPDEQSIITYVAQFLQHLPHNTEINARTLSLNEFHPRGVHSSSSVSCSSLESEGSELSCSGSGPVFISELDREEKSCLWNGQFLQSSREGHCWSYSAKGKYLYLSTEQGDAALWSHHPEEALNTLAELDSEEEDAFKYILELDHPEVGLQKDHLKSSLTPQVLPKISDAFYQEEGDENKTFSSLEMKKHDHREEQDISNICVQNLQKYLEGTFQAPAVESIVSEREKHLDKVCSSPKGGDCHKICSSDSPLGPTEMSLNQDGLTEKDEVKENHIFKRKNLENEDHPVESTLQTNSAADLEEPERTESSETTRDLSGCVLDSENDVLYMVLLLWILVYCIFIMQQSDIWIPF
ncbi:uncharacterized protein clmnb [Hoplias malabaricus]|uniref:uncharacterized protein clmnb n=1 Tax=Hoplias malabaricus TaxID=27720 RepID=UPI003462E6FD